MAHPMINQAEERKKREIKMGKQINFIQAMIPDSNIPNKTYDLILSTSFLHHLHHPQVLWQTIKKHSKSGTKIFIADLIRPERIREIR